MKDDVVARPVPQRRFPATVTRGSESAVGNERVMKKTMIHGRRLMGNLEVEFPAAMVELGGVHVGVMCVCLGVCI